MFSNNAAPFEVTIPTFTLKVSDAQMQSFVMHPLIHDSILQALSGDRLDQKIMRTVADNLAEEIPFFDNFPWDEEKELVRKIERELATAILIKFFELFPYMVEYDGARHFLSVEDMGKGVPENAVIYKSWTLTASYLYKDYSFSDAFDLCKETKEEI